jgi:hypothetical protein
MSLYSTKLDQLYRFIAGKIILSRNFFYRFIGDKTFGQQNCIALFDFFSRKLCICIALNDTFFSIAAHLCLREGAVGREAAAGEGFAERRFGKLHWLEEISKKKPDPAAEPGVLLNK